MLTDDHLAGTWRLVSLHRELVATGERTTERRKGLITFGPGRRVMTILVGRDRKRPAGEFPTDVERAALHKSLIAFAGRYEIAPDRLIFHVELSWNELWSGTEHTRFYSVDAGRMTFRTEPHVSATDGHESVYVQVWEKLASYPQS